MDTKGITEEARRAWNDAQVNAGGGDLAAALFAEGKDDAGAFYLGDNLRVMASLANEIRAGHRKPASLVYMDPPYFSNKEYTARVRVETKGGTAFAQLPAFSDTWKDEASLGIGAYLQMLTPRLTAAHELLADDGCLWLHLDRRAVHYAKVICDEIFNGPDHLINEVVWVYKSGGASKRRFANKHDTLLYYAKNKNCYKFFPQKEKSYNRGLSPYRFKGVKEYQDDVGWYTVVNMKDVWEIPMVGRTAGERTGYATQKPEALLERIVLSCTEAGDLCIDPFCGSGTLAAVCEKHDRPWICIDESPLALEIAAERLGLHKLYL
ncbi:MAG: site-specific DNA-methyltransferase [Clostridiales Family XIII bacterium]|jgi:site-specific DNA-methyltransferase (adenine-specific)/adenine-specific DNA-methyltransferase|nr:site-specific DNA-methyltransferase [Clostridiales Family XIII bacterium]